VPLDLPEPDESPVPPASPGRLARRCSDRPGEDMETTNRRPKVVPPGSGNDLNVLGDVVTSLVAGADTGGAYAVQQQATQPGADPRRTGTAGRTRASSCRRASTSSGWARRPSGPHRAPSSSGRGASRTRSSARNRGMPMIKLKRAYEPASKDDGLRVLVERLWPRGVSKQKAKIDLWLRASPAPGTPPPLPHRLDGRHELLDSAARPSLNSPLLLLLLMKGIGTTCTSTATRRAQNGSAGCALAPC
jgi:hypothetical protein